MKGTRRYATLGIVIMGLAALAAAPASAALMTLQDDNSILYVDSDLGMNGWEVEGVPQLELQWFWYRVGNTAEASISTLTYDAVKSGATDANQDGLADVAYLLYHDALGRFDVEVKVSLDGGPAGSYLSDVAEQITVKNTTAGQTLDFHFFQYAEFDLGGMADDDEVVHLGHSPQGKKTFDGEQKDDFWVLQWSEVASKNLSHVQADVWPNVFGLLTNGAADSLNDVEQAAGDVEWAYQWDFSLAPGEAFLLSKDKMITPEPATLALLGSGAALALLLRRRR